MLKYKKTKKTQENQVTSITNTSNQMPDLYTNKEKTQTKHLSLSQLRNRRRMPANSLSNVRSLVASGCAKDAFAPSQTDAITAHNAINVFSRWTITALGLLIASASTTTNTF
jgi:hypothetical protein